MSEKSPITLPLRIYQVRYPAITLPPMHGRSVYFRPRYLSAIEIGRLAHDSIMRNLIHPMLITRPPSLFASSHPAHKIAHEALRERHPVKVLAAELSTRARVRACLMAPVAVWLRDHYDAAHALSTVLRWNGTRGRRSRQVRSDRFRHLARSIDRNGSAAGSFSSAPAVPAGAATLALAVSTALAMTRERDKHAPSLAYVVAGALTAEADPSRDLPAVRDCLRRMSVTRQHKAIAAGHVFAPALLGEPWVRLVGGDGPTSMSYS